MAPSDGEHRYYGSTLEGHANAVVQQDDPVAFYHFKHSEGVDVLPKAVSDCRELHSSLALRT